MFFLHKGLEEFFWDGTKKEIQPRQAGKLEQILGRLNQAMEIGDMKLPGSGLHLLNFLNRQWVDNHCRIVYSKVDYL